MTTTDLARYETNAVAVLGDTTNALARLGEWVEAARHAHQLVAPLVDTAFMPDAYKPKVDPRASAEVKQAAREVAIANATAAVLQGITLGIDPLTALQQIYIVHGRPGMYAKLMVALAQAHGHEIWTEDLSDTRAVVGGRRRGSENIERVTVTMDQARRAGWATTNQAYTKTPQDMLWSRAAARVCDRIASDVLKGIASVEEIRDSIQAEAEVGNGQRVVTPRRRAVAAAQPAVEVEEPPLDEPAPAQAAPAAGAPASITAAQQRKLHALLKERDMSDRDIALVWIAGVIEREIGSTKELTVAEAGTVIDTLEANEAEADAEPTLDADWPDTAQAPPDSPVVT